MGRNVSLICIDQIFLVQLLFLIRENTAKLVPYSAFRQQLHNFWVTLQPSPPRHNSIKLNTMPHTLRRNPFNLQTRKMQTMTRTCLIHSATSSHTEFWIRYPLFDHRPSPRTSLKASAPAKHISDTVLVDDAKSIIISSRRLEIGTPDRHFQPRSTRVERGLREYELRHCVQTHRRKVATPATSDIKFGSTPHFFQLPSRKTINCMFFLPTPSLPNSKHDDSRIRSRVLPPITKSKCDQIESWQEVCGVWGSAFLQKKTITTS